MGGARLEKAEDQAGCLECAWMASMLFGPPLGGDFLQGDMSHHVLFGCAKDHPSKGSFDEVMCRSHIGKRHA